MTLTDKEIEKTKKCSDCLKHKPMSKFYPNKKNKGGFSHLCKECSYLYMRDWRQKNRERLNAESRETDRRLRKRRSKARAIFNKKYPNTVTAANILNGRIRRKSITRGSCLICGQKKVEAHHCDYLKPLDVIWYCTKHHRAWHRLFIPENK